MPREEMVISTFDKGIQSGADQTDIENGAAAWSIDENCDSIPGTIQPRLDDSIFLDTNNPYAIEKHAWITREDGKRDLIIYDAKTPSINAITDFFGTPAYGSSLGTPSGSSITMQTINRAVRMGQGNYASKYVGYIDQGQFGGAAPSATGLSYVDAELVPPTNFPTPYKIISDTSDSTYIYAIEWQGKKILKITSATGAYTESTMDFVSLQGICNIDATYLYVFDAIGNFGDLHKMQKSDMSLVATYHIVGWGSNTTTANPTGGTYLSDIELTTNDIWFGFWNESGWTLAQGGKVLYNFALASLSANGDHIPTDVTFTGDSTWVSQVTNGTLIRGTTSTVNWIEYGTDVGSGTFFPSTSYWVKPAKRMFVRTEVATEMGWLGDVGLMNRVFYVNGGSTIYYSIENDCRYGGRGIIILNESSAANDTLNSTNTKFRSLGTGVTSYLSTSVPAVKYTEGLRLVGATNTDYVFPGSGPNPIHVYRSNPTGDDEFILADAVWITTDVLADTANIGGTAIDKHEEVTWQDYVLTSGVGSGIINKSSVKVYDSLTMSVKSISTDTIGIFGMSTSTGNGRFVLMRFLATASYESLDAATTCVKVSTVVFIPTDTTNTEGIFDILKSYYYKIAYEYDNYQISPLVQFAPARVGSVATATNTINVKLEIYDFANIPKRATAILIYRAEGMNINAYSPSTLYRLAGRKSLIESWSTDSTESATWGTKKQSSFMDTGIYGPSYETDAGCPETLPNNTMDYTISCTGAGYLFVGQVYNDELTKVSNLIFRSKKNMPDVFDWSNDFCVLPTMPIGMHYFKGYLYAFDNSKMYVIDAEALVLVGEYDGYGISNTLAICSNEAAMYGGNQDNIWMHDGKTPSIISYPINQIGTSLAGVRSHRDLASGRTIVMAISPKYNSLVIAYMNYTSWTSGTLVSGRTYIIATYNSDDDFINLGGANQTGSVFTANGTTPTHWVHASVLTEAYTSIFIFNFIKNAWYFWNNTNVVGTNISYLTTDKRSLIVDYLGNIYLSVYKGMLKLCGSATGKACTWYSKLINFGNNTTLKKIYKVIFDGTCDGYIGYNTPTTITSSITSGTYINNTKYTTMQLKFMFTSGEIQRGITIIYRRMIGLR